MFILKVVVTFGIKAILWLALIISNAVWIVVFVRTYSIIGEVRLNTLRSGNEFRDVSEANRKLAIENSELKERFDEFKRGKLRIEGEINALRNGLEDIAGKVSGDLKSVREARLLVKDIHTAVTGLLREQYVPASD